MCAKANLEAVKNLLCALTERALFIKYLEKRIPAEIHPSNDFEKAAATRDDHDRSAHPEQRSPAGP